MSEKPTTNNNVQSDRTVLTVRVGSPEETFDELRKQFAMLDEDSYPRRTYEIVLQNEQDLNRLLNPNNIELLRTVAREQPTSIRETARLVNRDVRQVHDNLTELARLNLVQFETDGRAKRPVVWYDEIEVELPISMSEESTATA